MNQRLREVDREMKYEEYSGPRGRHRHRHHPAGRLPLHAARANRGVEALLPQAEQVPHERPQANARLKAYIVEVRKTAKGPQIVVSRTHPGLIKRLFEMEVPEIADGIVEIKACAREPGHRTKIAVWSNDPNVDPVGACVGARGARVRMVVNELSGEKIDIVPFSEVPEDFVAKALAPAKVKEVRLDDDTGTATVIVPDFQLSLAIGKEGQNARLAARLTGWRVDIKSETQLAEEEAYANQDWAEGEWVTDAATGEQVWQPAEGGEALSAEAWAEATEQIEAEAAASPTASRPRAASSEATASIPRRRPTTSGRAGRRPTAGRRRAEPTAPEADRRGRGGRRGGVAEASEPLRGRAVDRRAHRRPDAHLRRVPAARPGVELVRVARTADGGLAGRPPPPRPGRLALP